MALTRPLVPAAGVTPGEARTTWGRLWSSRSLLASWVRRDFTVRYRQTGLGLAWAAVQPVLLLAIYGLMFRQVLDVQPDRGPYLLFAWCGLVTWTFFASALSLALPSLITAQPIVTKVYFPREVVPMAAVIATGIDLLIGTAIMLVLALTIGSGIGLPIVALVPTYLALTSVVLAVALVGAALTVFVRDIRHMIQLSLQMLFILTPVMYPARLVPERWRTLYDANPLAVVIESTRTIVLERQWPDALPLAAVLAGGTVACLLALRYLRAVELRFPDVL